MTQLEAQLSLLEGEDYIDGITRLSTDLVSMDAIGNLVSSTHFTEVINERKIQLNALSLSIDGLGHKLVRLLKLWKQFITISDRVTDLLKSFDDNLNSCIDVGSFDSFSSFSVSGFIIDLLYSFQSYSSII